MKCCMEIWKELLGTFTGQLSLAVIVVVLIMAAFFTRMFITKAMNEQPAEGGKNNSGHNPVHL